MPLPAMPPRPRLALASAGNHRVDAKKQQALALCKRYGILVSPKLEKRLAGIDSRKAIEILNELLGPDELAQDEAETKLQLLEEELVAVVQEGGALLGRAGWIARVAV
jgi:hypothetical protein